MNSLIICEIRKSLAPCGRDGQGRARRHSCMTTKSRVKLHAIGNNGMVCSGSMSIASIVLQLLNLIFESFYTRVWILCKFQFGLKLQNRLFQGRKIYILSILRKLENDGTSQQNNTNFRTNILLSSYEQPIRIPKLTNLVSCFVKLMTG